MLKKLYKPATALAAVSLLTLVSCDKDTPAENAAEGVKEGVEEVGDAIEDATD